MGIIGWLRSWVLYSTRCFIMDNKIRYNQPNLIDTNLDLMADVVGALIAVFHVYYRDIKLKELP